MNNQINPGNTLDLEAQIRDTYHRLVADDQSGRRLGRFVTLHELRAELPADLPREAVDAALSNLADHSDVHITPRTDQRHASEQDQAAALWLGGQHNHWMTIDASRIPECVATRLRMRDRDQAVSMVAALFDEELDAVAEQLAVQPADDPWETRHRLVEQSVANHDAWMAEAKQERLDGHLLYEADTNRTWAEHMDADMRREVHEAAQRRIASGWWDDHTGLLDRAHRWRDATA